MQDTETPILVILELFKQSFHIGVVVPKDWIAGQCPVTFFHTWRGENSYLCTVVGSCSQQFLVCFISFVQRLQPLLHGFIVHTDMLRVNGQYHVLAFADIECVFGSGSNAHIIIPDRALCLASVIGSTGKSKSATDVGLAILITHKIHVDLLPVVCAIKKLRGVPGLV